jgi:hypothetical protein
LAAREALRSSRTALHAATDDIILPPAPASKGAQASRKPQQLAGAVATACQTGARLIWYQSGLSSDGTRDPAGLSWSAGPAKAHFHTISTPSAHGLHGAAAWWGDAHLPVGQPGMFGGYR